MTSTLISLQKELEVEPEDSSDEDDEDTPVEDPTDVSGDESVTSSDARRGAFTLEPTPEPSSEQDEGMDLHATIVLNVPSDTSAAETDPDFSDEISPEPIRGRGFDTDTLTTDPNLSDEISPEPLPDLDINFALDDKIAEMNKEFGEEKEEERGVYESLVIPIVSEPEPEVVVHKEILAEVIVKDEVIVEEAPVIIYDERYNDLCEKLRKSNKHYKKSSKRFTKYISSYLQNESLENSLTKCAYNFRKELIASKFDILVSGSGIRFINKPAVTNKMSMKKKKNDNVVKDPILASLPNTRASLKKQVSRSKKEIEEGKKACLEGITMYTEIVQNYENLQSYYKAVAEEYNLLEVVNSDNKISYKKWSDEVEERQDDITMLELIMSGQCVP